MQSRADIQSFSSDSKHHFMIREWKKSANTMDQSVPYHWLNPKGKNVLSRTRKSQTINNRKGPLIPSSKLNLLDHDCGLAVLNQQLKVNIS